MWNYQMLPTENNLLKKFGKYAFLAGIIFSFLGLIAIFYPVYAGFATTAFISWLMVVGGFVAGYFTFITNRKDWLGWLKAFILIVVGLLLLFYPLSAVESVGLLFVIYFLVDSFASFALGNMKYPAKGWWLWTLNGVISVVLAVIFLMSWPFVAEESWLIGIYVGISLLVDGLVLIITSSSIKNIEKS